MGTIRSAPKDEMGSELEGRSTDRVQWWYAGVGDSTNIEWPMSLPAGVAISVDRILDVRFEMDLGQCAIEEGKLVFLTEFYEPPDEDFTAAEEFEYAIADRGVYHLDTLANGNPQVRIESGSLIAKWKAACPLLVKHGVSETAVTGTDVAFMRYSEDHPEYADGTLVSVHDGSVEMRSDTAAADADVLAVSTDTLQARWGQWIVTSDGIIPAPFAPAVATAWSNALDYHSQNLWEGALSKFLKTAWPFAIPAAAVLVHERVKPDSSRRILITVGLPL